DAAATTTRLRHRGRVRLGPQGQRARVPAAGEPLDRGDGVLRGAAERQARDDVHHRNHRGPSPPRLATISIDGPTPHPPPPPSPRPPCPGDRAAAPGRRTSRTGGSAGRLTARRPEVPTSPVGVPDPGLASGELAVSITSNPARSTSRRSARGPNANTCRIG